MSFAVIIHEKGGQPRRQEFDKNEVTIGRVQGNDIILPKQNVSKRHSRVVVKDGKFIIVDLKSTNGTYVNGRKIASPMVIKETDKIYIGDFILSAEPMESEGKSDVATEAKPKAPPPPPRRQPPAPASPRTASPTAAATSTSARRPRKARPSPTSSPASRSGPPAAAEPAEPIQASNPAAPAQAPAPAAVVAPAPATPAPAPAAPPSSLNATAETAGRALYDWLHAYIASEGIAVPSGFAVDSSIDAQLVERLKKAALGALDGISGIDPEALAERSVAEVISAGPLSDLLGDASLDRIFFNGPEKAWVTRGGETTQHGSRFSSPTAMAACARRVLTGRGVTVEPDASFANCHFQDGVDFTWRLDEWAGLSSP